MPYTVCSACAIYTVALTLFSSNRGVSVFLKLKMSSKSQLYQHRIATSAPCISFTHTSQTDIFDPNLFFFSPQLFLFKICAAVSKPYKYRVFPLHIFKRDHSVLVPQEHNWNRFSSMTLLIVGWQKYRVCAILLIFFNCPVRLDKQFEWFPPTDLTAFSVSNGVVSDRFTTKIYFFSPVCHLSPWPLAAVWPHPRCGGIPETFCCPGWGVFWGGGHTTARIFIFVAETYSKSGIRMSGVYSFFFAVSPPLFPIVCLFFPPAQALLSFPVLCQCFPPSSSDVFAGRPYPFCNHVVVVIERFAAAGVKHVRFFSSLDSNIQSQRNKSAFRADLFAQNDILFVLGYSFQSTHIININFPPLHWENCMFEIWKQTVEYFKKFKPRQFYQIGFLNKDGLKHISNPDSSRYYCSGLV